MKEDAILDVIRENDPNALHLVSADRRVYYAIKRVMDFVIALVLLLLLSPMMLLIALVILLNSPGPIFFVQERVGAERQIRGKQFYWRRITFPCYKFRTMRINASPTIHQAYIQALIENDQKQMDALRGTSSIRKLVRDPRITPPGRFLRKFNLDGLPQPWNVLRGEMSLVGPSPALPYEVELYEPWWMQRLEVQPGITGLQQVTIRSSVDFDYLIRLDIQYIEKQSLWFDIVIMLKTVFVLLRTFARGVNQAVDSVFMSVVDSFPTLKSLQADASDSTSQRRGNTVSDLPNSYRISVSHPKLLSLRFEAPFLFQVYTSASRSLVSKNIRKEFAEQAMAEYVQQSIISLGQVIKVNFFSPDFIFSESVTKEISDKINKITFLGKPKDTCVPGMHKILVSISDATTNQEFESLAINVHVVDFAFDHISRPLLSKVSSVFLGLGSLAMFTLTFLQSIDKTFGLASGTAAAVAALAVYINFFSWYKRILPNTP